MAEIDFFVILDKTKHMNKIEKCPSWMLIFTAYNQNLRIL